MNQLSRDILTGVLFFAGISGFISGVFVFSAASFAAASLLSNMDAKADS
ncbi:MAG: hypothetical protein PHW13_02500 [Methylococcales bacterium]|nr:hypothetical protein [Methylococcales bacterium]